MNKKANYDDASHILVVDDDDRIRTLLKRYLAESGFRASIAADATQARSLIAAFDFDLFIFDVMMPGETGFSLTKFVRDISNVPILLLTARGLPEDRIEGLEAGADDYLSKPFEPRELLLRVNSLLRRSKPAQLSRKEVQFGDCNFSIGRGELRKNGELVRLTAGEASLLRALAQKPREPISREALAQQSDAGMERSVDVQVTRLRKKIEEDPRAPIYLQTVRGVGYALMAD
ncbi:response regulator [Hyphococcus flavus]|uniref:Response regulator n=1 Tax=Hyphococcus flavus TaxID=1866326 RepID=A0AAE9ZCT0_9PROT|nr:response regulator [Hyphococcus flavus]WDI30592.1 response regulator [Hyphococcus flavus]